MRILVLETSTTSAKAMLYTVPDNSVTKNTVSADNDFSVATQVLKTGYEDPTLHDPEAVFLQTAALGKHVCNGIDVDVIAIVTTWHSLILADRHFTPLSPTYLWSNQLADSLCTSLKKSTDYHRSYYEQTGCVVSTAYPYFKYRAYTGQESINDVGLRPDQHRLLCQGSYSLYRLTGHSAVLNSMASGSGFYNIHDHDYDASLLSSVGLVSSQLPRVVSGNVHFPLSAEGAELLSLKVGTPVLAPGPDGAFNQIASDPEHIFRDLLKEPSTVMSLSVGTSGAIRVFTKKPYLSETFSTWCYALEDGYLCGAATSGACNCVDDIRQELFEPSVSYSDLEQLLDHHHTDFLKRSPIYLPFKYGERSPGWNNHRQSGFIYAFESSPSECASQPILSYYASLEGVLFNLYQCYLELTKNTGKPKLIRLSGGILNSRYWIQLCADLFDMPMEISNIQHASLYGGALLAQNSLSKFSQKEGIYTTVNTDAPIVFPDPRRKDGLQKRFRQYLTEYAKSE